MIRLFISSTFEDMTEERDAIHTRIFPELREYGIQKGVYVEICDLRWGIYLENDWNEDRVNSEVMHVCFDEVRRCKPYIIGILGGHYGSVPANTGIIQERWRALTDAPLPADCSISLTQWELEFAFLSSQDPETRSLCLLKQTDDADPRAAMLQRRVRAKAAQSDGRILCREYSGISPFCEELFAYVRQLIDQEAVARESWVEDELDYAGVLCREKAESFAGREDTFQKVRSLLRTPGKQVLGIHGEAGIGKTTFLSNLYLQLREESVPCAILICGSNEASSNYLKVLLQLIYLLERAADGDQSMADDVISEIRSDEHAEKRLSAVIDRYEQSEQTHPYYLILDALNQIRSDGAERMIRLLRQCRLDKIRVICSQIKPFSFGDDPAFEDLEMRSLCRQDIVGILRERLFDRSQQIDVENNAVIRSILDKRGSSHPLYLDMMIQILKMHVSDFKGSSLAMIQRIQQLPEEPVALCRTVLQDASRYLRSNAVIDEANLLRSVSMIAVSRHGLRETDLENLLHEHGWKALDFVLYRRYLPRYFRQRENGCWDFAHDLIRRSVLESSGLIGMTAREMQDALYANVKRSDDAELLIKEGLYLSSVYRDSETAFRIFREAETASYPLRHTVVSELTEILLSSEGRAWFQTLIQERPEAVIRLLRAMLEFKVNEDYPRRYPACSITKVFWRAAGLTDQKALQDWCRQRGRSFQDQFHLAMLCAEYVNTCESIGRLTDSLEYLCFAMQFLQDPAHLAQYSRAQRTVVFKQINSVFYVNNKILIEVGRSGDEALYQQTRDRSIATMQFVQRDALDINPESDDTPDDIRGVYERFLSNFGQYYNAIREYGTAMNYHFQSLMMKAKNLLLQYSQDGQARWQTFSALCREAEISALLDALRPREIVQNDFSGHIAFWRETERMLLTGAEAREALANRWKLLGVSYRTLGTDCFYTKPDNPDYDSFIRFGCSCMDASVFLLSNASFDISRRESLMSEIRRIGLYCKKKELTAAERRNLTAWCREICDEYMEYSVFFGLQEGRNLKNNMTALRDRLQAEGHSGDVSRLESMIDKVHHILKQEESRNGI